MRSSLALPVLAAALASAQGVFTVSARTASGVESPGGEVVIDLSGDVRVTDGDVTITADSGRVWQTSGRAVFVGSVEVSADTVTATGNRLEYDRAGGTATLIGNAVLTDGETDLSADQVVFYRYAEKAIATGGVLMTGPMLGRVTGDYALYDLVERSLFVTVSPELRRIEGGDSLVITADRLVFLPDSERAEAQGNAVLVAPGRDMTAVSELLRFHGSEDRVELLGSPDVTTPDGEISGNYIDASLAGGELSSLRIEGSARGHFVDSTVDPPGESWFQSERAWFEFSNGSPDSVALEGSVTLTVRSGGEAAERLESNAVSGERLTVSYSGGSPEVVTVTGGVRGTYTYRREE